MMVKILRLQRARRSRWLPALVAILLITWGGWAQPEIDAPSETREVPAMSDFGARIRRIEEQIVDLTWIGGLFEYPEFREIHGTPASYLDDAWEALKSPEFTDQQKKIIVLSMQNLDLPRFLRFASYMLGLLESGSVSHDVFELAVFPPHDWNTKLVEGYEQPDVARFLQAALKLEQVGDLRKEIIREEILTGEAKSYVLTMREVGLLGWPVGIKPEAP